MGNPARNKGPVRKKQVPNNSAKRLRSPKTAKLYLIFAAAVLTISTFWWALLSARLQSSNADQLVYPYLFQTVSSFHGALLPEAHTFLIKWPIFFLLGHIGISSSSLIVATIALTMVSVAGLAWLVRLIEPRRWAVGTLWLVMAAMLMLTPAQPTSGALLPVNMAMLATRNIEYLVYILSILLVIRPRRLNHWQFWLGTSLLALLIASDHLFLALSIGGASLALVVYALVSNWKLVSLATRWLLSGLLATVVAMMLLSAINATGLTHIQAGSSPYVLTHQPKDIALGTLYGALGVLTNFGANPAFDATVVHNLPHQALSRLFSIGGPAFLACLGALLVGLVMSWRLVAPGIFSRKKSTAAIDKSLQLSIVLLWSSVAALCFFIASNHYYAVDSRYLTIGFFAVFVAAARFMRQKTWRPERLVLIGAVALVAVMCGSWSMLQNYHQSQAALAPINQRNTTVAQVLKNHRVNSLIGDYWRVVPTKLDAGNRVNITPLGGCVQSSQSLTSKVWQPNLQKHSFAYLLSTDRGLTNYPACTLEQVVAHYGRPNASQLIAGDLSSPKELLLFYDHGSHKSASVIEAAPTSPATVVPTSLDSLPHTSCNKLTVMNVVAHEDDDILFLNPALTHSIKAADCIRTVYITAGDDGAGQFYWLSRQQGAEAAYSAMIGSNVVWIQRIVKLSDHQYLTIANPLGNDKISLIFMNLPDGNLKGEGFAPSNYESLAKLTTNQITTLRSVDGQSTYNTSQLIDTLTSLMYTYQPGEIRTQATYVSAQYPDHSDHMAVSRLTQKAYEQYESEHFNNEVTIPFHRYIGYPIHAMPTNVSGQDLADKEAAFLAYAKHDAHVCHSIAECTHDAAYGAYLPRQYQQSP